METNDFDSHTNWKTLGAEAAKIVQKLEKTAGPRNAQKGRRSTGSSKSSATAGEEATRDWLRQLARKRVVGASVF